MFYKTDRIFRDFLIDCSENEFFPKMALLIDGKMFGYNFQTESFFAEDIGKAKEYQRLFEEKFQTTFLMDLPKYTEYLKQKEELYELNIEQMEELLFRC